MDKKTFIYIGCGLILCAGCYFAGGIGPGRRAEKLGSRITDLEGQLESAIDRNRDLADGLRDANGKIAEISLENLLLTESNRDLTERLGKLGEGTGEDIERVSGIIERIRAYSEEAETP